MTAGIRNPAIDVLAIDVGSSFIKIGWFPRGGSSPAGPTTSAISTLPGPALFGRIPHRGCTPREWGQGLARWIDGAGVSESAWCLVGSVQPEVSDALVAQLGRRRWGGVRLIKAGDVPLAVRTFEPLRVGVDRLLGALAANRLRSPQAPAVTVDVGTAATVNLIAADGGFEGGAILAGPGLCLQALHEQTASLPALDERAIAPMPAAAGKSTEQAMAAGAYWGLVGAVRELVGRMASVLGAAPELFLTGGASAPYAAALAQDFMPVRHVPHLVLGGIRLAADALIGP